MHVISYKKIRDFCAKHDDATSSLNRWYRIVKHETFQMFADVRQLFPSADQVGDFVIFNIGGNKYRLVAFIRYPLKRVFITLIEQKLRVPQIQGVQGRSRNKLLRALGNAEDGVSSAFPACWVVAESEA